ncbi:MAG: hypothetical protein PHV02_18250 [Rhodocyclaceae bacterium]|nr:hypothetical protein [Rhodocyclaceae bacterium]
MTTVRTKEELKQAQLAGFSEIIVVGELAGKLKKAKKIAALGGAALAVLTVSLGAATVAAPVTGGLSFVAAAATAAPVAALTGVEIAAIIAASAVGIALVLAVYKDYEEISYESGKLVLKKRK